MTDRLSQRNRAPSSVPNGQSEHGCAHSTSQEPCSGSPQGHGGLHSEALSLQNALGASAPAPSQLQRGLRAGCSVSNCGRDLPGHSHAEDAEVSTAERPPRVTSTGQPEPRASGCTARPQPSASERPGRALLWSPALRGEGEGPCKFQRHCRQLAPSLRPGPTTVLLRTFFLEGEGERGRESYT